MAKKKRVRKISVYGHLEGDREQAFVSALIGIYKTTDNNISPEFNSANGGAPNKIIADTLKQCHRDKAFAWFDEDFEPNDPLSIELRNKLAVCWCIKKADLPEFYTCSIKDLQQTYNSQIPKNLH